MNFKVLCSMALGLSLVAASPSQAARCSKDSDCSVGQVCSLGTCKARSSGSATSSSSNADGAMGARRIAWGNIGYYNVSESVPTPFFGNISVSDSAFGLNVGTAVNVYSISADVPLALWGNAAIAFPSGGTLFPLTAGAAVRYDKLPVGLLGGLGLTIMPNSIAGAPTPVGLAIQGMGFLPLPEVTPSFGANLQMAYHFMNNGFGLFTLTAGGTFSY